MATFSTILCGLVLLPVTSVTEEPPTLPQIEQLVRDFAFSRQTGLNPKTEFKVRRFEVAGLWEAMRIEVFDVAYMSNGQSFDGFLGIYHDGQVSELARSFGGHGLMSGLVHQDEFYYTYSWGSGLHRTHIAKLKIVDGKISRLESDAYPHVDLFVSESRDGKLRVSAGTFKDFNQWKESVEIGTIAEPVESDLRVLDPHGIVVAPESVYRDGKKQQR